jgi:hypothetical protein
MMKVIPETQKRTMRTKLDIYRDPGVITGQTRMSVLAPHSKLRAH